MSAIRTAAVFSILMLAGCGSFAYAHASSSTTPLRKTVELTFDDGPYGTSTEQVLQILKYKRVHATFFLIGQNVARYPLEAQEIVAAGNAIGNHTYTHTDLSTISVGQALGDIALAEQEIASTTGIYTQLFRPPYGILPQATRTALLAQRYRIVMWNDDPEDWNYASSSKDQIIARVLSQDKKKEHLTVIFHDGRDTRINYPRDNLIQALPIIIDDLRKQGYSFITFRMSSST